MYRFCMYSFWITFSLTKSQKRSDVQIEMKINLLQPHRFGYLYFLKTKKRAQRKSEATHIEQQDHHYYFDEWMQSLIVVNSIELSVWSLLYWCCNYQVNYLFWVWCSFSKNHIWPFMRAVLKIQGRRSSELLFVLEVVNLTQPKFIYDISTW